MLYDLPEEILAHIFEYQPNSGLKALSLACKYFCALVQEIMGAGCADFRPLLANIGQVGAAGPRISLLAPRVPRGHPEPVLAPNSPFKGANLIAGLMKSFDDEPSLQIYVTNTHGCTHLKFVTFLYGGTLICGCKSDLYKREAQIALAQALNASTQVDIINNTLRFGDIKFMLYMPQLVRVATCCRMDADFVVPQVRELHHICGRTNDMSEAAQVFPGVKLLILSLEFKTQFVFYKFETFKGLEHVHVNTTCFGDSYQERRTAHTRFWRNRPLINKLTIYGDFNYWKQYAYMFKSIQIIKSMEGP